MGLLAKFLGRQTTPTTPPVVEENSDHRRIIADAVASENYWGAVRLVEKTAKEDPETAKSTIDKIVKMKPNDVTYFIADIGGCGEPDIARYAIGSLLKIDFQPETRNEAQREVARTIRRIAGQYNTGGQYKPAPDVVLYTIDRLAEFPPACVSTAIREIQQLCSNSSKQIIEHGAKTLGKLARDDSVAVESLFFLGRDPSYASYIIGILLEIGSDAALEKIDQLCKTHRSQSDLTYDTLDRLIKSGKENAIIKAMEMIKAYMGNIKTFDKIFDLHAQFIQAAQNPDGQTPFPQKALKIAATNLAGEWIDVDTIHRTTHQQRRQMRNIFEKAEKFDLIPQGVVEASDKAIATAAKVTRLKHNMHVTHNRLFSTEP